MCFYIWQPGLCGHQTIKASVSEWQKVNLAVLINYDSVSSNVTEVRITIGVINMEDLCFAFSPEWLLSHLYLN